MSRIWRFNDLGYELREHISLNIYNQFIIDKYFKLWSNDCIYPLKFDLAFYLSDHEVSWYRLFLGCKLGYSDLISWLCLSWWYFVSSYVIHGFLGLYLVNENLQNLKESWFDALSVLSMICFVLRKCWLLGWLAFLCRNKMSISLADSIHTVDLTLDLTHIWTHFY